MNLNKLYHWALVILFFPLCGIMMLWDWLFPVKTQGSGVGELF